jgi:hypothetical protein
VETYVREARLAEEIVYPDATNQSDRLKTVQDAVAALQRELIALDVLISTIKANPEPFR